jgi:phosphonate transport system substrate-binding protein
VRCFDKFKPENRMKRRSWLGLFLALAVGMAQAAESGAHFRIGVAPHTSARVIVEMYQPLRLHLEKSLARPVEIVTAGDFTEFARRGLQQDYDLAITTGHQARLFESDAGYLPLLTYKAEFKAVILVATTSRYKEAKDLVGSTVIGLSPASLVTIWGQHWLHRNSVPNVTLRYVSASDSVAQLVLSGEGSAGMTSLANYQNLQAPIRDRLRIMEESLPLAGRVYMLNKRHAALKDKVDAALWSFAETAEAQQYFAKFKLGGYRKLEARELFTMTPYANEVRQVLKQGK